MNQKIAKEKMILAYYFSILKRQTILLKKGKSIVWIKKDGSVVDRKKICALDSA